LRRTSKESIAKAVDEMNKGSVIYRSQFRPLGACVRTVKVQEDTNPLLSGNLQLAGQKIARRNASCTWDVTHERALSPADLFGGKTPVGA